MTPDFALSLSFEGIRLLHRTSEGWTPVGEVPLDSRDLAGDLAALRQAGLALGLLRTGTKLLLPEEQIRTLTLDDPRAGPEAARTALDGATPYAVEDLVVDQVSDGARTHVAAVARETLEEAEAFAAEHGFQPIGFAARPADYPGEAFFGPTSLAASFVGGAPVTRDEPPSQAAEPPAPERVEAPAEAPGTPQTLHAATAPGPGPAEDALSRPEPASRAEAAPPEATPSEPPAEPAPEAAPPGPVVTSVAAAPASRIAPSESAALDPAAQAEPVASEPTSPEPRPEPLAVAPEPEAEAPPPPPVRAAPPRAGTRLSASGVPEPVFSSRARPLQGERRESGAPIAADRRPQDAARQEPRIGLPPRPTGPAAMPAGAAALAAPPEVARRASPVVPPKPSAPAAIARREPPVAKATPLPEAVPPETASPEALAATLQAPRRGPDAAPSGKAPRATSAGRARAAASRVGGKPRFLGLILTVVLLLIMAAVFAWAAVSDQGLAGLFRRDALPPTELATAAPAADPAPARPAALPQPEVEAAAAAVAAALQALPATPETAEPAPAATGVWLDGPGQPTQPEAEAEAEATLAAVATPEAAPASDADLPRLAALAPDAAFAAPEPPPSPAAEAPAEVAAPVVAGLPPLVPPTRPAEETAAAWANAMSEAPAKAPRLRPDGLVPPETALAAAQATDAPALPSLAAADAAPPAAPEELLAALAPGADPLPGSAALLPGALAFAPAAQPGAAVVAPGGVSLAGLRPSARPEDLAPEAAEEPEELAAWEGPRPGLRPEGLAPEEPASPDVTDALAEAIATPETPAEAAAPAAPQQPDLQSTLAAIVANSPDPLAGATRQAVPSARRPDSRPANFGRVVATQLDRIARASQPRAAPAAAAPAAQAASTAGNLQANERAESEPEVASSAAAAPNGPTAASVAQAATYQDAIALREINLIGVYGQPNARRALIRMGNGSYVRVSVGDRLDGGQVTAIGDNVLNYVKRGRTEVLVIPGG